MYTCDVCGKNLTRQYYLNNHKKSHSSESEQFVCKFCKAVFTAKYSLKVHLESKHKKKLQKANITEILNNSKGLQPVKSKLEQKWQCYLCAKFIKTKQGLQYHMKRHYIENARINSPHCNKTFAVKHSMSLHIRNIHPEVEAEAKQEVKNSPQTSIGVGHHAKPKEAVITTSIKDVVHGNAAGMQMSHPHPCTVPQQQIEQTAPTQPTYKPPNAESSQSKFKINLRKLPKTTHLFAL